MSDTATTEPPRPHTPDQGLALRPAGIPLTLIVTLLVPMFLTASGGDIALARMAAIETVNAYGARGHAELIAVAQIIACGLTALGSLSLSMADDLTLSMTLRLRGNANALLRATEQIRRAQKQRRLDELAPDQTEVAEIRHDPAPDDALYEAEVLARVAATHQRVAETRAGQPQDPRAAVAAAPTQETAPRSPAPPAPTTPAALTPAPTTPAPTTRAPATPSPAPPIRTGSAPMTMDELRKLAWASAMSDVANEFTASLGSLPPAERKMASMRANALSTCATQLLSGEPAVFPTTPG